MPSKSKHPCPKHPWILVGNGAGCPACAQQPALQRPHPSDNRPSATERGYGYYEWKTKVRDPYIAKHPWCADPFKRHSRPVKAVIVDHIKTKKQGGTNDESNLQSLCFSCHERKKSIDGSRTH